MQKILSTVQLKTFWNDYTHSYIIKIQESTTSVYNLLIPFGNLSKATRIVEVGCGSGNGLETLINKVPKTAELLGSDIAESMISQAKLKNIPNCKLIVADNENLPYPNSYCDRYIANLSLQIVENPEKMLVESYRILQPGGIALFSVWGKPQPTNLFAITSKKCTEAGYPPQTRSLFHLNDDELLKKMILNAGFSKVLSFYSAVGFGIASTEETEFVIEDMQVLKDTKEQSEIGYNQAIKLIKEEANKVFQSGKALTFDTLLAIAYKK